MKMITNMKEMFDYLDSINDSSDLRYDDCKMHSFDHVEVYEKFLIKILELYDKPKRVVDIGSNLNQYAYIFNNFGIDYVGIDLWNASHFMKPYENEHSTFIGARYEDIADWFKDDIIISNLCVGYLVKIEDVKARHLIINELDKNTHKFEANVIY